MRPHRDDFTRRGVGSVWQTVPGEVQRR